MKHLCIGLLFLPLLGCSVLYESEVDRLEGGEVGSAGADAGTQSIEHTVVLRVSGPGELSAWDDNDTELKNCHGVTGTNIEMVCEFTVLEGQSMSIEPERDDEGTSFRFFGDCEQDPCILDVESDLTIVGRFGTPDF